VSAVEGDVRSLFVRHYRKSNITLKNAKNEGHDTEERNAGDISIDHAVQVLAQPCSLGGL